MNAPADGKFVASATVRVRCVPSIVWPPPLTVVLVVEMTTAPSSGLPVQPLRPVNFVVPLMPV